jgi:hypothetical protein
MMTTSNVNLILLLGAALLVTSTSATAQEPYGYRNGDQLDLIGGVTDPRNYDTGFFLDTEYGRYTDRNAHPHLDVSFGTLDTKAGLIDKLASKAFEFRLSAVQPILQGEVPFALHNEWTGELQLGLVASYSRAWYDTNTNANIVQGANTFRLDDLDTNLWGFGPDARFLFPPNKRGMRVFVGARFEGLGGWANPDLSRVAAPNPANGVITVKQSADVGKSDDVWGIRGEWSAGLMFCNEMTVSASFGMTKLRTKVIDDLENNNDSTFWSINLGIPTDVIFCGARRVVSKIGF